MLRYLSLSWKIVLVMLLLLLLMVVWFTSLTLLHSEHQFQRQQKETRLQGQQYFEHYNQTLDRQLQLWMQSFADTRQLHLADDFTDFATVLPLQVETLELNFRLQQLWLYTAEQQLLYQSGRGLPKAGSSLLDTTLASQQPQAQINCERNCYKLLSLPLLNAQGEVAVLIMAAELTDVLFALHQTLQADIAILHYQPQHNTLETQVSVLQASNMPLIEMLYQHLPDNVNVETALNQGLAVDAAGEHFFLHLIPLQQTASQQHLLLMIENVSEVFTENRQYRQTILWVAVACFALLVILTMLITRRLSRRILTLASALPLLAQRRYAEFRNASKTRPTVLRDELSTFNESVFNLSVELEQLDKRIVQNNAALEKMAMFDQLTGLANRNMLEYQIDQGLAALALRPGYVGLVFLDLDKFKTINNSRSHAVGDQLLIETAKRLQSLVSAAELVCRFGGDEFAIVLMYMTHPEKAQQLAEKVLALFNDSFNVEHSDMQLSASIGVSYTDKSQLRSEELIRQADLAMYQAKQHGRNRIYTFNEQMSDELAGRLQLEAELRLAISEQQFSLSLQPQVRLDTGTLYGFEALLRWQHPQRGMVAPDEFISVLEQAQLMVGVGYWVFERCCQLCVQLIEAGLSDIVIAVNLSADQFLDPQLPALYRKLLAEYQLSAHHFELELTEGTLVSHVNQTLDIMHQLKEQGFKFAIDDFGTGYSSLNYLKRMPVDTIKIDKSFISGMLDNSSDYQIIISTIAMVQKLGLQVVAEGVEERSQLRVLQQQHCDLVQGYYFSRPIPEHQLAAFVQQQVLHEHWPNALLI